MKITLIRPQDHYAYTHPLANMRPLGLFLIAAALEKAGFATQILDFHLKRNQEIPLEQHLARKQSEIYAITALTASRFEAVDIAQRIKALHPSSRVVVGGAHFTHCAVETLEKVPYIDVVVKGSGLSAMVEVARAVQQNSDLSGIHSIVYRRGSDVVENATRDADAGMIDELPLYTNFPPGDYTENLRGYHREPVKAMSTMASTGCPAQCAFCAKVVKGYRTRSADKVVDELLFLKERYHVEAFNFVDMTFTASPRHVTDICNGLLSCGAGIRWWCESRVDMQLPLLKLMKEAGCVSISAGVESGSDRILSMMAKGINRERIRAFCKSCDELGIYLHLFFMYSHLNETREDVRDSLEFIQELRRFPLVSINTFQPTMIFPGSDLETIARRSGLLPADFSWYNPYYHDLNKRLGQITNIPLFMDRFSPQDLVEICDEVRSCLLG
jgi:anaerobic magnesium-protoporphyrin IX monomethyl ester cyclase